MTEKKYDASIPREMFWSNKIQDSRLCPTCNAKLEKKYHTYLVLSRKGEDYESFISGNDAGKFCPNCDIVVLDRNMFAKSVSFATRHSSSFEFTVVGLVDLDAIPDDKKGTPIGGDDNPIPLVKFKKHNKHNNDISASEKQKKILKFYRQQRKKKKKKRY